MSNINEKNRIEKLRGIMRERVIIVDGAMGTSIQNLCLSAQDFGGDEYEGCNEYLNVTRPDVVKAIHHSFLESGADVIETNSFGSTPLVLAEYGLEDHALIISRSAAQIARKIADDFSTQDWPRFVAGSMGPTTKAISITGGVTWEDLAEHYMIQAIGLIEGQVDLLLLETSQDTLNVKAALEGIDRATKTLGVQIPVAIQCTIETMGTTLGGQDIEAFYTSISHRELLWVGLNCATGPEFMRDHLRTLSRLSRFPVTVIPNAGLPDEDGTYNETPESIATTLNEYLDSGWLNVIGGCCGTTPEHIKKLFEISQGSTPRSHVPPKTTEVSGLDAFVIDDDTRPVIVGERTNVLGSRRFKRLISEGKIEEAAEIGRHQVRSGAHIVDVCLQDPDRDEVSDITNFLKILTRKIKAPIIIDSTDDSVIEEALRMTPGKSIINSINLEDGEDRFKSVVPLSRRYGAALIVGCIDEDKDQAQAITRERKLEIAQRSNEILTSKYGVPPEDVIFDPLVFPIGTGDQNYIRAGVETIEGVRLIKNKLPKAKTILGISNVSFGLPPAGREVLNSVFLYHCVQAGLDLAIVNSEGMVRYASISDEDKKICEDLIWWRGKDPIKAFAAHFRQRPPEKPRVDRNSIPIEKRVASCVIEGSKEGLLEDLDELLKTVPPLNIINGPLMDGMDEVGRLFGKNELIVAEVLESAEAMKSAVNHLEPYMESAGEATSRGTIILATVKGDVHDIGKNLVDIILSNNGYKVINLGIKIPPFDLIDACRKYEPDIVGLSGLLVKSAQMMVDTVRDFQSAGLSVPVLVGGAALSNRFTRLRISPEYKGMVVYSQDAMTGLALTGNLVNTKEREKLRVQLDEEYLLLVQDEKSKQNRERSQPSVEKNRTSISKVIAPPQPPDVITHVIDDYDLAEVFPYINPTMLYVRHLGFRGRFLELLDAGDVKALELRSHVKEVEEIMLARPDIRAKTVYKFFRSASDGDDVVILSPNGKKEIERFRFGRQESGDGLCLADYLQTIESGVADYVALFVTTVGPGIRELAEEWKSDGNFLKSHILQLLALEGAEGFAELIHERIRAMWGIGERVALSKEDLFKTRYQGRRFSFGYPACPRLEDQVNIWRLLDPENNIDVKLTEEYMMEPEGSVSALVFHHPEAKYFNLRQSDTETLEKRIESEQSEQGGASG
ncbi:MAG: 5-methyltetrahydrofolate--homocysteine methyltransferase [Chloroflexi bacterium]|jgi:5-methyltetrahydrofolate--homocysteine methyltransferase|nr:MAG: 5-methyltetrahydrofolate--homocysteine methyltransferase [Chloroflexota bacterium]